MREGAVAGENYVELLDEGQAWHQLVLDERYDAALELSDALLDQAEINKENCYLTNTLTPKKIRFQGRQERAYRFVYCVFNQYAATSTEVIRHRCDNRLCINPDHMIVGDRTENHWDEMEFRANGVDPRYL